MIWQTVEEALNAIQEHVGPADTFTLAVADSINDDLGVTMAILTDAVLARGWLPDGYDERADYRIYRYTEGD